MSSFPQVVTLQGLAARVPVDELWHVALLLIQKLSFNKSELSPGREKQNQTKPGQLKFIQA